MTRTLSETMTLGDVLVRAAHRDPHHEALVFPDTRLTYAGLLERAVDRARSLLSLGVGPGDHVGILMPNLPEVTELMFGASLIGAIPVPINARFKERELAYVTTDADLVVLVTTDVVAEHVDYVELLHAALPGLAEAPDPWGLDLEVAPRLRAVVCTGSDARYRGMLGRDEFADAAVRVPRDEIERLRCQVRLRDTAVMIYTSGTTAEPKGAPLSHEALVRTCLAAGRVRFELTQKDRIWDPLPMFHMSSILPLVAIFDAGGVFISLTHFTVAAAIDQIIAERPTVAYPTFPTITAGLIAHRRWPEVDLGSLRAVVNVAPEDMLRAYQRAFGDAVQMAAYGLSEAAGVVAYTELTDDLDARVTTSGRPFPGIELQVVDPETLEPVAADVEGEIWVKGFNLFDGYWKDPAKTAEAITDDGWLRTGDLGSLDPDGRVRYHGRLKDMLKVGGENVAAIEIEAFLTGHPAVLLAQVVGIPDDKYVEVPAAFVELQEGATVTQEELIEFCRGKIASFKIPKRVVFVDEWPMSATKVKKYELRDRLVNGTI